MKMKSSGNTLSFELLKALLSVYFSITLVVTLAQMGIEYLHTRNMIQSELVRIERTFYPALATALWEINQEQLDALQQGILNLPIISSIRVVDSKGKSMTRAAAANLSGVGVVHVFKVSHRFSGKDVPLAEVTFEAAGDVVFERLKLGYQMILVSALIKSVALTLLFVWMFRRHLGVPLGKLTDAVASVDLNSLGRKRIDLGLTRENELTRLESAFNRMLSKLGDERRAHDAKLEALNKGLEEEVLNRTLALEAANSRLEQLVRTDPLTGAANRRHFVERADIEIQRARRGGAPLSLLMLDLDYFKRINDTWGHAAGDEVLRNFVGVASAPLRSADLLARIGGEEFAILLPDTGRAGAEEVAQRIREAARQQVLACNDEQIRYTVSIGMALLQDGDANFDTLFNRADAALYHAKQAGRDRVESA